MKEQSEYYDTTQLILSTAKGCPFPTSKAQGCMASKFEEDEDICYYTSYIKVNELI